MLSIAISLPTTFPAPTTTPGLTYYRVTITDPGSDCSDPVSSSLTVLVQPDATVSVADIMGREVMSSEVKMNESAKLDLSELPEGMYIIKVTAGDLQHVEKLILQH